MNKIAVRKEGMLNSNKMVFHGKYLTRRGELMGGYGKDFLYLIWLIHYN